MRTHAIRSRSRSSNPHVDELGILTLTGYGVRVSVERGHLAFSDGIAAIRRSGRLARATCGLKRLVVLGHTGFVTFEAMRWLHDVGAAFVQIDADGNVITVSAPVGLDDARLRRTQALSAANGVGLVLARGLIRDKLNGQLLVLTQRFPTATDALSLTQRALDELEHAQTLDRIRIAEANGAAAYWSAWSDLALTFARRDDARVPDHWRAFGVRRSPLTGGSRSAGNPINAVLNYLYAMLEVEARIAALTMGLDPGIGVLHADQRSRDSFACDVMEPIRPQVDAMALELIQSRTFALRDFFETRYGQCRLMPSVSKLLAGTAPAIRKLIAPVAERMAHAFFDAEPKRRSVRSLPTLLTETNRANRNTTAPARQRAPRGVIRTTAGCRECGVVLETNNRGYCKECLPARYEVVGREHFATGPSALTKLRAEGRDPAHGAEAARKRGATAAARLRANAEWEAEHGSDFDPDEFRREVLPRIQAMSVNAIARATGLSLRYCSLVRAGERVPHPRHWATLKLKN
jgi:CRISPR-associated endonuclease Cas1